MTIVWASVDTEPSRARIVSVAVKRIMSVFPQ
jgi:hypothetical protein